MQWFIFIGMCRVELSRLGQCSHGIIGLRFQKMKKQNKEKPLRLLKINQYFPLGSVRLLRSCAMKQNIRMSLSVTSPLHPALLLGQ